METVNTTAGTLRWGPWPLAEYGQMKNVLLISTFLAAGVCRSSIHEEQQSAENEDLKCSQRYEHLHSNTEHYLPRQSAGFSDIIHPTVTMNIVLTTTPNPFWMSIPSVESKPGYCR